MNRRQLQKVSTLSLNKDNKLDAEIQELLVVRKTLLVELENCDDGDKTK